MHFHKPALLAVVAALGLLIAGGGSASAASYLHDGATTGSVLSAGTQVMTRGGGTASLNGSPLGSWSCGATTFGATVGASGSATISATLHSITFSSCSDTLPAVIVTTCESVSPLPTITITATGENGGTVGLDNFYLRCNVSGSTLACYYNVASANGAYGNSGGTLVYNSAFAAYTLPPGGSGGLGTGICSNGGSFNMSFSDLVVSSSGTTVRLNTTS